LGFGYRNNCGKNTSNIFIISIQYPKAPEMKKNIARDVENKPNIGDQV